MAEPREPAPPRWADARADALGRLIADAREATSATASATVRARIATELFTGIVPSRQRRFRLPVLTALAVGAALALVILSSLRTPEARVLGTNAPLPAGGRLATGGSSATLSFGRDELELGPRSQLHVDSSGVVVLERGQARLRGQRSFRKARLRVGTFEAEVDSGEVRFEVASAEAFSVQVFEGRAILRNAEQRIVLVAGQSFDVGMGAAATPPAPPVADSVMAEVALYQRARTELSSAATARDAQRDLREELRRFPEGVLTQEAALSLVDADLRANDRAAALEDSEAFLARFPSAERDADVRLVRANLLRERGEYSAAAGAYAALETLPGATGADALFLHGVCEAALGHRESARTLFLTYRSRFPAGARRHNVDRALDGKKIFEGPPPAATSTPQLNEADGASSRP